jgi:DnaJ-class molecular chaperone
MSTTLINCPKCGGRGTQYSVYNGQTKCGHCNGTGKIKVRK